ncbi:hypothetical protein ACLB2K_033378 [Fragaria x ananassa]
MRLLGFDGRKKAEKPRRVRQRVREKREQRKEGERLLILFWLLIYRFWIIIVPILTVLICLYSFEQCGTWAFSSLLGLLPIEGARKTTDPPLHSRTGPVERGDFAGGKCCL